MKGTIFILFEDFVGAELGEDGLDDVLAAAGQADGEPYVGPGNYPAEHLLALLTAAAGQLGEPADAVLRRFGRYAFPALARSAPALLDGVGGARQFLEQLDTIVHSEVRKLDPEAEPARFTVLTETADALLLEYESRLGLFPLVSGFLDGVGDWYQTPLDHDLVSTRGSNGTFRVVFPPAPAGAGAVAHA